MAPKPIKSGDVLDKRYEIQEPLGEGGFGTTYRAIDRGRLREVCAVKELRAERQSDESSDRLFEREARTLLALSHPRIPKLQAYFPARGRFFLVQDFVKGETLIARVRRERFDEKKVQDIVLQVLDILGYLHSLTPPVVHGDIKPHNLMEADDGSIYLIDFGAVFVARSATHTAATTPIISAGYSPKEQYDGRPSPASDIFALGATALHLISGQHPTTWHDDETGLPNWQGRLDCSAHFEAVLGKMMADVATRFRNVDEVRQALLDQSFGSAMGTETSRDRRSGQTASGGPDEDRTTFIPVDSRLHRPTPGQGAVDPYSPDFAPPARSRKSPWQRFALPIATGAVVLAVTAALVRGRNHSPGTPRDSSMSSNALSPSVAALPADWPVGEGTVACASEVRVPFRTESAWDGRISCPTGWRSGYATAVRAEVLTSVDGMQVWSALWPAVGEESQSVFRARWTSAMQGQLGRLDVTDGPVLDDRTRQYTIKADRLPMSPSGSLQIEQVTVGQATYYVWSLMLGGNGTSRPGAEKALASIRFGPPERGNRDTVR